MAQPRVRLRAWKHEDLPEYREWLRPHHDWHRWDGPYFPRPTDSDADAMVKHLSEVIGEFYDSVVMGVLREEWENRA